MILERDRPRDADDATGDRCDDPALVRHAQVDTAAFDALFACFWLILVRYCYRSLGQLQDAEDVTQTVFVKAILHLSAFEPRGAGSLRAWLFRIAHNETLRVLDSAHRRHAVPFPDDDLLDPLATPEAEALDLTTDDWLAGLIGRLPARQREVMQLRAAGLTTAEIARALGKSEAAVRKAQERATDRLRALVAEQGGWPS